MKQVALLLVAVFGLQIAQAQVGSDDRLTAQKLISSHAGALGLSDNDLRELIISSTYYRAQDDIRMIYCQQTYLGIPVFNQMQVIAFKGDKLVSSTGSRLRDMEHLVSVSDGQTRMPASEAVRSALLESKAAVPAISDPVQRADGKWNFGKMGIALYDIVAEKVWLPISDKQVKLTWQVEWAPLTSRDHWLIRVDAITGQVLDKNNYTVFENFDQLEKNVRTTLMNGHEDAQDGHALQLGAPAQGPTVVNGASYNVIPYPAESPIHTGGTQTVVNNPWNLTPGNATSLGWHYDGTTYHDSTRGNNVWAQEDRDNNNATFGKAGLSSTAQPNLTFGNTYDFAQGPTVNANQQMAITNLFYWNNLVHDITYLYGFDEPSGNFQNNNQARGGAGADYVIADAQDAGGTNNANFSTPNDGTNPRMQMYLWTSVTPNRDGDLDNGIIIHEYAHGISNRLTGGPANSSCLGNAEQGGEGWSDYFALMYTHDWATALPTDGFNKPRGIGTYALNQPTSGVGIRTYRYCTDMTVNPWTYGMVATNTNGAVHTIGSIWCTFLWEMTWEMIAQDGINPNIFNPNGTGGNTAALKLVVEGMRLQPCSPGFVDARNAILKADTIFYGGKYSCSIWKAFAKRGLGAFASQGSSSSYTDQVANFESVGSIQFNVTQSVSSQAEGQNVTYTNRVTAGSCGGLTNYLITDTLPSNVTYVSGGTYNSANRVVSFPVNLAAGQTQDYSFTVQINNGSYFPADTILYDKVTSAAGTIPSTWTATSTTTSVWTTQTTRSRSAPSSYFTPNRTTASEQILATTASYALGPNTQGLNFWHWYNSEGNWDGGVIEISTNGGTTWTDLSSAITRNGYSGTLGTGSALANRQAFTGNSGGFIETRVNLASYVNQSVKFRFRFASDGSVASTGWNVDDIFVGRTAKVEIKSNLFNSASLLVSTTDTFTLILQANPCGPGSTVSVSGQPSSVSVCEGGNASFSVTASGPTPSYQWQVSTNGGASYNDISGETNASLSLTGITVSMSANRYRCLVSNACTNPAAISNAAILTVNAKPSAPQAGNGSVCGSGSVILTATAGVGETIDWYASSSGGTAISNGSSSLNTGNLVITTIYYAEARNLSTGCVSATRTAVTATVNSLPAAPTTSGGISVCGSGVMNLSANPGSGQTIDWYAAPTGGSAIQTGSASFTTPLLNVTTTYYAETRDLATGCVSASRTAVTATVNSLPAAPTPSGGIPVCGSGVINLTAIPGSGQTIDWYAVPTGGSAIQTGSASYSTPLLTVTTTYYAEARDLATGCVSSSRTAITATVNKLPANPTGQDASRCGQGSVTLNATPGAAGETIDWYVVPSGGLTVSSSSTSYITGTLSATTTYYAESRVIATGCLSAVRTPVTATIRQNSTSTTAITICNSELPYTWNNQTFTEGGTFNVTLTNAAGCDSIATLLLDIAPAIQVFTVTGGGSYISGGAGLPVGLSSSQPGISYQLILNGVTPIGSPITGTGASISFGNQLTGGSYTVHATSTLCEADMANSVTVTVIPSTIPLAFQVTGGGTYCLGGNGIEIGLAGSETGVSYQLQRNSGSVNVGSPVAGTGSAISFGLQTTAADYSVLATHNISLNTTAMLNTVLVRVAQIRAPSAPGAVTGPTDVCNFAGGAPVLYRINQTSNATSYLWTAPAGATIIGSNTDTVVSIQYPNTFTSGTLSVVSINACFSNATSSTRSVTIRKNVAGTPGAITASVSNPCSIVGTNNTATYTIRKVTYATGYSWTLPSGMTLVSNFGDTGIIVRFETGFSTGVLSVRATNDCSISSARSLTVTASVPAVPASISGQASVCSFVGQSVTANYSITAVSGAASYEWSVPANASIASGQGTTSIEVNFLAGFTSGSISVRSVAPCGNSSFRTFSVSATKPGTPAVVFGPTQVCSYVGQPIVASYSVDPVANASSYLWTPPANATIVTGQGTPNIEMSFSTAFTYGTLTVKAVANCGSSSTRSLGLTKLITKPGAITASADPCPNATVTYSISPVPNATNYLWTLPSNATYVSGQGTTSYTITLKPAFTTGTVAVRAQNQCSSSSAATLALDASTCAPAQFVKKTDISTSEPGELALMNVFPNPSTGKFSVSLRMKQPGDAITIQLVDMYGRIVYEKKETVTVGRQSIFTPVVDAPHLVAGLYELRCTNGVSVTSTRVIISR